MSCEKQIEQIFREAERKYSNNIFEKKFLRYKRVIVVSSFNNEDIKSSKEIRKKLKKIYKNINVKVVSNVSRKLGFLTKKIISEEKFKKRKLFFLYFKEPKDEIFIILSGFS